MYGRFEYPPNTMIKCVMVGGEGHGQSYTRSPNESYGFKMQKRTVRPGFFKSLSEEDMNLAIDTERIDYEPFAEICVRPMGFVRLFKVSDLYTASDKVSFLIIADALRIAGVMAL